jgi:hypothetical protein
MREEGRHGGKGSMSAKVPRSVTLVGQGSNSNNHFWNLRRKGHTLDVPIF